MRPGNHQGLLDLSRQKVRFGKTVIRGVPVCSTRIPTASAGAVPPIKMDGTPALGIKQ